MTRAILLIAGLGFVAFGLKALIDPIGFWVQFDLPVTDVPAVRTELRAFYGGLEIGVGLAILWHLPASRRQSGLVLCLIIYGVLGLARGAGILIDGAATTMHLTALAIELAIALLAAIALRRERAST